MLTCHMNFKYPQPSIGQRGGPIVRLWVGHYHRNSREWFLVWAESPEEAARAANGEIGKVDQTSLRELRGSGMIGFQADLVRHRGSEYPELEVSYGDFAFDDDAVDRWIRVRLRRDHGMSRRRLPVATPGLARKDP